MTSWGDFVSLFAQFHLFDWLGMIIFFAGLLGYRFFLSYMLNNQPEKLFLGKLQDYRHAWIDTHSGGKGDMVVVQTLRNMIMSASFLASTAVILIMGAFNLLQTLDTSGKSLTTLAISGHSDPSVEAFKILLIIIILSYSFFNFTWYIREVNYMSFILNIPKSQLDEIEGHDSITQIAQMFLTSGIYFSLGMRGYYFLIPLLMWLFDPLLMILSTLIILYILVRRDLARRQAVQRGG
jgi:uncharacterized membrane protein